MIALATDSPKTFARSTRLGKDDHWGYFSRNVAYGMVGRAAQWGLSFFLLAYVIRRLGAEGFSLIVTGTAVVTFIGLVQLGASSGFAKQLATAHARDPKRLFPHYYTAAVMLSWVLALLIAVGVLIALAASRAVTNVPVALEAEGRLVLGSLGFAAVCSCLGLPSQAALQAVHRIDLTEKANLLGLALRAICVIAAFSSVDASPVLYAAILAAEAALVLAISHASARSVISEARAALSTTPFHVYKEVLRFNLLTFFDTMNYVIFMQAPVLLIQKVGGLLPAGQYGVGLQLNNLIRGFSVAVSTALSPIAMSLEAKGRRTEFRDLFCVATRDFLAAALFLWVNACFLGQPFLSLWLRRDVAPLVEALPWLLAASATGVATLPAALYLVAMRQVRVPAAAGLILACGMTATLALSIGRATAPLVWTAALLFAFFGAYQLLRVAVVARTLNLSTTELVGVVWPSLLPAGTSAGVLWAFGAWAPPIASWSGLITAAGASAVIGAITAYRLGTFDTWRRRGASGMTDGSSQAHAPVDCESCSGSPAGPTRSG